MRLLQDRQPKNLAMSRGINKNILKVIEFTNSVADKVHNIKTSYTSLKKDKKQRQQLNET